MGSLKPRTWETTESWKTNENDIYARVSIGSFILNNQHSIEPFKSNDFSSQHNNTTEELLKDRKNTPQSDKCKKKILIFIFLPGILSSLTVYKLRPST